MTKVMQSKPAKHGKRLEGKQVIITCKESGHQIRGIYLRKYKGSFALENDNLKMTNSCNRWTVEEIIETEE